MIARIYVRQKIQKGSAFDYNFTGPPPPIHSLVEVPFSNGKTMGFVDSVQSKSKFASKSILRVLSKSSVFTPDQIRLAGVMANYYLSSFAEVIFSYLPNLNLKDLKLLGSDIKVQKNKKTEIHQILSSKGERIEYFSQVLSFDKPHLGQTVIVLPTIKEISEASVLLKKYLPMQKIVLWHSYLKKKEKALIWQQILLGENLIIIGTRHSLFLPYTYLKNIFVDDPLNFAYQEDQAPYYNAYTVARMLAKISRANLFIGGETPDIYAFVGILRKSIVLTELKSNLKIKALPIFSNKILINQDILENQLNCKKRVLVVGNWKDTFRLMCTDCKKPVSCMGCNSETFTGPNNACVECAVVNPLLLCRICKGTNIKRLGFDRAEFQKDMEGVFPRFKNNFSYLTWGELEKSDLSFDIALIPYFSLMLNSPYLRNRQKLFRQIRGLKSYAIDYVYIYGENLEDNKFVRQLKNNDWKGFLMEELSERKELNLPPFSRSFLIKFKDKNVKRGAENLSKWCQKISEMGQISFLPSPEKAQIFALIPRQAFGRFSKAVDINRANNIYLSADPLEFS